MEGIPTKNCPVCEHNGLFAFFGATGIPTQDGIMYQSRDDALRAPSGDIKLIYCHRCHYIFNEAYDPARMNFSDYEMNMHYSKTYQQHNQDVIDFLVNEVQLTGKTILDAGCGNGYFLVDLCQKTNNTGIGIDPSFNNSDNLSFDPGQITFIKAYYDERQADQMVDFIVCKQVIDELADPAQFVKCFKHNLSSQDPIGVYIEIQNGMVTFENQLVWNIGYAKKSWFTIESITYLLESNGFEVKNVKSLLKGAYLGVLAAPAEADKVSSPSTNRSILSTLKAFSDSYEREGKKWRSLMDRWLAEGKKIALWGAGMRGINFLSAFPDHQLISQVIDINPNRKNKYLPRSGFKVEAPEALKTQRIDMIIISNSIYAQEIMEQAKDLGYSGAFEIL